jgi:hypothetical protein
MRVIPLPYRFQLGRTELLPLCDVHVLGPRGRTRVRAVVDSGAFEPVFHVGVADDAGISLRRSALVRVEYGGSTTLGRRTRVHIELEQHRFDTEIIFVEQLDLPYGLLGRRTIFSQFNEVVFLEKVSPPRVELRW